MSVAMDLELEGLQDALNTAGEIELEFAGTVIGGPPGPKGKDGKDGVDGQDGQDGADGKDGRDGTDGANGLSPTIVIGEVTTTAPGTSAEVSLTGVYPNYRLNLKLPRGIKGEDGDTGPQGLPGTGTATVFRSPDMPPNSVGEDGDFWFVLK